MGRALFFLHMLKKAKRLKESFSESASSVCYLKRDIEYLLYRPLVLYVRTYIHASYTYDLVCYTLYLIPYTVVPAKY